jgi:hypothetical protein
MKKQILALLGVGTLAYGSVNLTFTETQASLTAPSTWTIGYYNLTDGGSYRDWFLQGTGGVYYSDPGYTRSGSAPNYNYDSNWNYSNLPNVIPNGMTILQSFPNNTNGLWSSTGTGLYYPNASNIGTTLTGFLQIILEIQNQTNRSYIYYFDRSSSGSDEIFGLLYNNTEYGNQILYKNTLNTFLIPPYTNFKLQTWSSTSQMLDAWYLRDLGVSQSYEQGFDDGYDVGYDDGLDDGYDVGYEQGYNVGLEDGYPTGFSDGFDAGFSDGLVIAPIGVLFQSAFGAVASIFNIQVLGNLTLGSIIIAPIAVALLWFILGIVSGVGVGGKKK